jgi:hypothetical protein
MAVTKPGQGPDSKPGRVALLARLQLLKGELDGLVWSHERAVVRLFHAEVHGNRPRLMSVSVGSGAGRRSTPILRIPKSEPRLAAFEDVFALAYELQGYGAFEQRGWLRQQIDGSVVWAGGAVGLEAVKCAEISAEELQDWLRSAICEVAAAEQPPHQRRSHVLQRDIKDLLITASDGIEARARALGLPRSANPHHGMQLSRRDLGLGGPGDGALVGDPPRPMAEARVRDALEECCRRKLLSDGDTKTRARKYEMTDLGWAMAHTTVKLDRACLMLRTQTLQIRFVGKALELHAGESGIPIKFDVG